MDVKDVTAAQADRDAAFAAFEKIGDEIAEQKAVIAANEPATVVAAGGSLADAAKRQADARHSLEFLTDAKDHAWQAVLTAETKLKLAHAHRKWDSKLTAAIAARIEACGNYEAAGAAQARAAAAYSSATETIAAAFSDGIPRPDFLREYPLHLPATVDHTPKMQMRPADDEAKLWGKFNERS